jgi:thiazolylpeptide-type bacteriocin precursor
MNDAGSVLRAELEMLEAETFEITDYEEVVEDLAGGCSSTSSSSTCSSTTSCTSCASCG